MRHPGLRVSFGFALRRSARSKSRYNGAMARGWESKSVEDQINERNNAAAETARTKLTPDEAERRTKKEGILLARTRTVSVLESTRDERYRALLERTLAHLDSQLADLDR